MKDNWKVWDKEYGKMFRDRANGKQPEMESSKSVAKHLLNILSENDTIMDVGCGAGHYLRTLDRVTKTKFSYIGIDATEQYIEFAKEANEKNISPLRINTSFKVGDIFNLSSNNSKTDIVMCNNLLLHLPSIKKPIEELCKVAKKYLIIRTLIGKVSFRIQHVDDEECYNENGEPKKFLFFNIYSKKYIASILDSLPGITKYTFIEDKNYDPKKIGEINYIGKEKPKDLTTIIDGKQINNYIIEPWCFLIIEKE